MGRMQVSGLQNFANALEVLGQAGTGLSKKALWEGAKVIADRIKANIETLPVDRGRVLNTRAGEKFNVVTSSLKEELRDSFGIAPMQEDSGGVNVVMGFKGYSRTKTRKYPNGLPIQMIARSIESGSSVRQKRPFFRPAVNAAKSDAIAAMDKAMRDGINDITGGNH